MLAHRWLAIAAVWSLTPLSWAYAAYYIVTAVPELSSARPTPTTLVLVIQSIIFAFAIAEVIFSIWYRYLAIKANKLRAPPHYSRKFLRSVLRRALESGLSMEDVEEEVAQQMDAEMHKATRAVTEKLRRKLSSKSRSSTYELRSRPSQLGGDGSTTPEIGKELQLPDLPIARKTSDAAAAAAASGPASAAPSRTASTIMSSRPDRIRGDDEGYGASLRSSESLPSGNGNEKRYAPSFIPDKLTPDDPRAVDFRGWLINWFINATTFEDIRLDNMSEWLAWSLYGQSLEDLQKEREEWHTSGKPPPHLDGEPDVDEDGLDIEADKLGLVGEPLQKACSSELLRRFAQDLSLRTLRRDDRSSGGYGL